MSARIFMFNLFAQANDNAAAALLGGALTGVYFICGIIGYIVFAVALMTIANKTGLAEKAWWGWVPILNILLMLEIAELPVWFIVLFLIPCFNFFLGIYIWWKIAEKRGKPGPIALAILFPILGFFVPLYIAFSD